MADLRRYLSLLLLCLASFGQAWAHTDLTASIPAADSTVAAPAVISLEFGDEVKLARVQLISDKETMTLPLDRSSPMAKVTEIILEHSLGEGRYIVKWAAMGTDGHIMRGEFGFTVKE